MAWSFEAEVDVDLLFGVIDTTSVELSLQPGHGHQRQLAIKQVVNLCGLG
jgi:hypothetical protein